MTTPPAVIVAPRSPTKPPEHLVQLVLVHVVFLPTAGGRVLAAVLRPGRCLRATAGSRTLGKPLGRWGGRVSPRAATQAATPARLGTSSRGHQVVHVDLGGLLADAERRADLPVRAARGDQDRHLALPRGQLDGGRCSRPGRRRAGTASSTTAAAAMVCGPRAALARRPSRPACGRGAGRGRPGAGPRPRSRGRPLAHGRRTQHRRVARRSTLRPGRAASSAIASRHCAVPRRSPTCVVQP